MKKTLLSPNHVSVKSGMPHTPFLGSCQVGATIFVAEEHIFAPVATLGDVVRNASEYDSRKPGHGHSLTRANNMCAPFI